LKITQRIGEEKTNLAGFSPVLLANGATAGISVCEVFVGANIVECMQASQLDHFTAFSKGTTANSAVFIALCFPSSEHCATSQILFRHFDCKNEKLSFRNDVDRGNDKRFFRILLRLERAS
jgi:hypothetical protein